MEKNELLTAARNFLSERMDSLKNDVNRCLATKYKVTNPAPFPAILYCFSVIDLLGALYAGDATSNAHTTEQAKNYMIDFMNYPADEVDLLQKVFRHKLVHLSLPHPRIKMKGKYYIWAVCHDNPSIHLQVRPAQKSNEVHFHISIQTLVKDITDSVSGSDGYLNRLEKNENCLQEKFNTAYRLSLIHI